MRKEVTEQEVIAVLERAKGPLSTAQIVNLVEFRREKIRRKLRAHMREIGVPGVTED